jgi:hypothetical protein
MSGVTLGDLLREADSQFARAASPRGRLDQLRALPHLRRLTFTLTRYLDGNPAENLRLALMAAAIRMEETEANLVVTTTGSPNPRLRALRAATDQLAAGADLIETHAVTDKYGTRIDRSDWARLLRTETLAAATAGEITHWADRLAGLCADLATVPTLVGSPVPACLTTVAKCLSGATTVPPANAEVGNGRVTGWELLYTIPAAAPPASKSARDTDTPDDLAEAAAISAARLKAASFATPANADWSPDISAHVWRSTAHVSAVTLEVAQRVMDSAGERGEAAEFRVAAVALRAARQAWHQIGKTWAVIATDTNSGQSAVTAEANDLALRLCRLAFGDPGWEPRRGALISKEKIADLSDPQRLKLTLGAVHRAADAIAQMAVADLEVIRRFGYTGRFYMPNRILDDPYVDYRKFIAAPMDRIHLLIESYQVAIAETARAADVLDELAVRHDTPSKTLAMARKALVLDQAATPGVDPGDVASRLRYLDRPKRAHSTPRNKLDADAVIRAYRDDKLSLRQCADKFTTSPVQIKTILTDHSIELRPRWHRSPVASILLEHPAPITAASPEGLPHGPVESEVRAAGITEPAIVARAAELDKLIARTRITAATAETQNRPRRRATPTAKQATREGRGA